MMFWMNKKAKILLVISLIFLLQLEGASICMAYKERDEYAKAFQKIFDSLDSFTFTFDYQSIQYAVYFGGMFLPYNNTHKRFVSDVFVVTLNEYFVGLLSADLDFDVTFIATGILILYSAIRSDSSSFTQFDDVIYEFEIYEFFVHKDLFPVTLRIDFNWELSSSEFNRIGHYDVTQKFDWNPFRTLIIVVSVIGIVAVSSIVTIIVVRRRKRRAEISPSIRPNSKA